MPGPSKSIEEVLSEIDAALSTDTKETFVPTQTAGIPAVLTQHDIRLPLPHVFVPDPTPLSQLPDYFTKTQLKKNRRWTELEISYFLGEPDLLKTTQSFHTCQLYEAERVLAVEHSIDWRSAVNRPAQIPLPRFDRDMRFGFYRVRDLFDRGWYQVDIKTFLGEPHRYGRNAQGYPTKLYKRVTVHNVEATEGWQYRRSAVAPILYQQGVSLSRIKDLLGMSLSQVYNFTTPIRKAIREGKTERGEIKSQTPKPTRRSPKPTRRCQLAADTRERKAREKQTAFELYEAGVPKAQIAKRLGRHRTTVSRWIAECRRKG